MKTAIATDDDPGPLLSTQEAARALEVTTRELYRLIDAGHVGAVRDGPVFRVPVSEIDRRGGLTD